jgi:hypothetical protein
MVDLLGIFLCVIFCNQKYRNFKVQQAARFFPLGHLAKYKIFFILAIAIAIAHFWHVADFGLYADDYARVGKVMSMTAEEIARKLLSLVFLESGQGRPLHDSLIFLLALLGDKLGGLVAIYSISYSIVLVNSLLFYKLLKLLFDQEVFALTGALAFALFPADTTKTWLTSSFGLQPSLTFLLLAFYCYLTQRKKISYLIIFGSLIAYETVFPVFLAAPLLSQQRDRKWLHQLARHALIMGILLIGVVALRKLAGDNRVSELEFVPLVRHILFNSLVGPLTSIAMFFYRPLQTLLSLKGELLLFVPLCFAGLAWMLSKTKSEQWDNPNYITTAFDSKVLTVKVSAFLKSPIKLAWASAIALVLAYPFTLTLSALDIDGEQSRVHLAAVIGGSLLCACICSAIVSIAKTYQYKNVAIAIVSTFFALLIGFGLLVQQDYRTSWQYQQAFWQDLVRLCPDLNDQTEILVEPTKLKTLKYRTAVDWSTALVLEQIYNFPQYWSSPPTVHLLRTDWRKHIVANNNNFKLNESTIASSKAHYRYRRVNSSQIIFLETNSGKLTRRTQPLIVGGRAFSLKEKVSKRLPSLDKGHLYDPLIGEADNNSIEYLN